MRVSILGAGNVASHLAKAITNTDIELEYIYARDSKKAQDLVDQIGVGKAVSCLDFSESKSQVFFICISDDSIEKVANSIVVPKNSLVVHTSGGKSMQELYSLKEKFACKVGVFYPLQTFSKNVHINFRDVPLLIEAEDGAALEVLKFIGTKLSDSVQFANSSDRLKYHISAVLSCNFPNHLWGLSKNMLEEENLNFNLLKPLILETVNKMFKAQHPFDVQTGPAVRNDSSTLNKHEGFLDKTPDLLKIYVELSKSILNSHKKNI